MSDSPRRPTLATIAQRLGVNPSTVSRALSPKSSVSGTVSATMIERVRRAVDDLGYVPNRFGATLRTGRSHALGILVPHTSEWVVGKVYEGIDSAAAELGYVTFVANTFDDEEVRETRLGTLSQWGVDAILYADSRLDADDLERVNGVPCWPIIRRGVRDHRFRVDDEAGGRLVARHLIDSGYRDAAVITGPPYASTFRDRVGGFLDEYAKLGGRADPERVIHTDLSVESGKREAARLLDHMQPAAIFAVHDPLALGAYVAAAERRIRIGAELGVVGYNDIDMASQLPVPITSVNWECHALGAAIAENAIARLEGREEPAEVPRPVLIQRQSTERGGPFPMAIDTRRCHG